MKQIKKIAIANRGEVACRIHRTCKKLGIKTVLLHSEPDIKTIAYRLCDETYNIGPGPTQQSYLNIEAQIQGALKMGADAIHPGFGFLSENAEFAKKVIQAGLIFIGPSPEVIEAFGDKIKAKSLCKSADVPMVPGFQFEGAPVDKLIQESDRIGYPVLVKAAAGGGGRGMRLIQKREDAEKEILSAQNEALKAFGNSSVFLEKYLDNAKHIEVQIFGDAEGKVHVLGERECSVQRKHQKIIEETPSPSLSEKQREEVLSYAKRIGEQGQYTNAGTVEFMFQDNQFYFLEVNTRLQVEHTVTEEVLGLDLVEAQILTAGGKVYPFPKKVNFSNLKHSIELRLYAEDPYQNGIPSTGVLGTIEIPKSSSRRIEIGFEKNDEVSPFYDSMIAKLISTQASRIDAISDLVDLLKTSTIFGVQTNTPLLIQILNHSDFILGTMTTRFFERNFSKALVPKIDPASMGEIENLLTKRMEIKTPSSALNPWGQAWRNDELYNLKDKHKFEIKNFEQIGTYIWWKFGADTFKFNLKKTRKNSGSTSSGEIIAPMPGSVFKILCEPNQSVEPGQALVILEAMKMEHTLKSDLKGKVKKINFKPGDSVQSDDILIEIGE